MAIPKWLTMPIFCQNKEKKLAIIRQQIGRFRFRILFLLRSANINHYVLQNLAHSENLGFHSFGKSRWNDPVPMHERDDLNTRCNCLPLFSHPYSVRAVTLARTSSGNATCWCLATRVIVACQWTSSLLFYCIDRKGKWQDYCITLIIYYSNFFK